MKRIYFILLSLCFFNVSVAQNVSAQLKAAFEQFENDPQLKNAIASLYVIDGKTGKVIFEKNGLVGLAPASTQKVITSVTAYEILGENFRYKTDFGYAGNLVGGKINGNIFIKPSGDPTLGSWRWKYNNEEAVMGRLMDAVRKAGFNNVTNILVDESGWDGEVVPDGWIWQDIGNYYGAGADALNWRENQYDLILKSGNNIGDKVEVAGTTPKLYNYSFTSFATAAAKGTGDNAYIYFPLHSTKGILRGTIPVSETKFTISGAMPSAKNQFVSTLADSLSRIKIPVQTNSPLNANGDKITVFHTEYSPKLDSIIYWFNKKSINLYGEALIKTIGLKKASKATTDKGISLLKEFWKDKGVAVTELNMVDGSGLSPLNRVTTHAQATILLYAKKQPWFAGFYDALPEYNGMKMKSGTIRGAKGFTGYHTGKNGNEYVFSIIVNNYNGSAGAVVQKMYKVLDVLK